MKITRPSVAMWCHLTNQWYIIDMFNSTEWFDTASKADHKAFNNFLEYSSYLEKYIQDLERNLDNL